METKEYRLDELLEITSGGTPKRAISQYYEGGTIPWVKTGDLKKKYITSTPEHITEHGLRNSSAKLFPANTVLIAIYGATIGATSILGIEAATNQACAALLPSEKVHPEYLYYYLKSIRPILVSKGQGGGQPNISGKILKETKINLPPLDDQIRIAGVLSKAENLIKQREKSIDLLDKFLKMKFLEMFGDPVLNEKSWGTETMDTVIEEIISGTSYGGDEKEELNSDELGVLKISAVTQGIFNHNEFKAVKKSDILKPVVPVKKGMFLMSRANTKELVAACCIVYSDYPSLFIPDKLWSLIIDEDKIHPVYLNFLLKNESYRNIVRKEASGGHDSMLNISMKKFRDLALPIPDSEIQKQFAQIVEKIDLLKSRFESHLLLLGNLRSSLSQKALKGKLEITEKVHIEGTINVEPKISGEVIVIDNINKELEEFHKSQPHTGAPDAIDNTIRQLEAELKIKGEIPFWDEYVKYRIVKGKFKEPFTFDQLWEKITQFPFETVPEYDEVSSMLFKWLAEKDAFIRQEFNASTKQMELVLNETSHVQ